MRLPDRRGRPSLDEAPQQVGFEPATPLALRLDPDRELWSGVPGRWRRKLDLSPCQLVWIGAVVASPDGSPTPHIEALVSPLTEPSQNAFVVRTLPITVLWQLSVGRVLKEKNKDADGPSPERRFLGSEWNVDLWFGGPETSITTAAHMPALAIATLAEHPRFAEPPLCIVVDAAARRLVAIPCWEIFRVYYAQASRVARLIFQFPRWGAGTLERLLWTFTGHEFRGNGFPEPASRDDPEMSYALAQLRAIGREAAVSYARSGRADIRAIPPFLGPAKLRCVAIPVASEGFEALFVQQIIASEPAPDAKPGIGWWPSPVRPRFRSRREVAAWWAAYRCGAVPDIDGARRSWEDFVALADARAEAEALRRDGLRLLAEAFLRAVGEQRERLRPP